MNVYRGMQQLHGVKVRPCTRSSVISWPYNEKVIRSCYNGTSLFGGIQEGYVLRLTDAFHYNDFSKSVGKFVRKDHVQSNQHWMTHAVIPNKLAK